MELALNDGRSFPMLGLGFWRARAEQAADIVRTAVQAGYRGFDTAAIYRNEEGVGEGVRTCGLPRSALSVTTKLWIDQQGYDSALRGFEFSLSRLGLDYLDLYLLHWPADAIVESWRALIRLKEEGRVRSIGVSNFTIQHLERVIGETGVVPAVNQIELHPHFQQRALRAVHQRLGIATQSWAPLGQGRSLEDPVVARIAAKHGKTAAQATIRWHLQSGLMTIPKSATPSRIVENFGVFDFALDEEDMAALAALDSEDGRISVDPALPYPYPERRSPENR